VRRFLVLLSCAVFIFAKAGVAQTSNPISYVYDDLGRLVAVTDPNADTATYSYDAVGNVVSISRYNSSQLSIIYFTPSSGTVGTTVTIFGTAFSPTPSQNTVQFNGTTASITSATSTQLVVTVPSGSSTGPIKVITSAGSVTSTKSFSVSGASGAPTITGFTPSIGLAGASVNIAGSNFDSSTLSNDVVELNLTRAIPTAATSASITTSVPASTTSGHLSVRTPAGKAVSGSYFFVPPPPYTVSTVQYTGQMSIGGQTNVTITTASKIGLLVFDGTQGQSVNLQVSGGTFGNCNLTISILTPSGNTLGSNNCMGISGYLGTVTLPSTGTYTVLLVPSGSSTGSITVNLYNTTDITGTITSSGAPVTVTTTVPGQKVRLTFTGTIGQVVSAEAAGFGGGSFTLSILNSGSTLASVSGTNMLSLTGKTLASAGTYTLLIAPNSNVSGSVTTSLISQTTNNTITYNTPITKSISATSLIGLSFSGAAGQIVSTEAAGFAGGNFSTYILNPDGSTLVSTYSSGAGIFIGKTLATTGTYQILILPDNGVTGSVTVSIISQTTNGTITFNTPVTKTITIPSTMIGLSFSGTAGQIVSAEAAGLNGWFTTYILKPDGTTLVSAYRGGTASFVGKTLATAGTYQIIILPDSGVTGSVTSSLTSQTTNGTITFNTPATQSVSVSSLIGLDFSGTAGQIVSAEAAGLNGWFTAYILKPDGTTLASGYRGGNANFFGMTLATTGTYQILIFPDSGVTGSVTLSLISQTTNGTITFNTPVTQSVSVSSLIGLDFSGTAGQIVSAEAAGLNGWFTTYILKPDGTTLVSAYRNGTASFVGKTLATTGTYQILIFPDNGVTGSVTLSLISQTSNDIITFNTPVKKSISVTSLIGLSFSGAAGNTASVQITPSFGSSYFSSYILNPNGSVLASSYSNGSVNFAGKSLSTTGTYQVLIVPDNGVTGSVTVLLTSP